MRLEKRGTLYSGVTCPGGQSTAGDTLLRDRPLEPFRENFPLYGICPLFIFCTWESVSVLSQATRNALHGDDPLDQLAEDFAALDIENILTQTLFAVQPLSLSDRCALMVPECKCVCVCG